MAYLPRMKYRRFGRTAIQMPVISCGGMRYQYKWQDVDPKEVPKENQENLEATIRRAVELGINHIETARGYGSSEMQLGNILPTFPRDKIIVQTKVAPHKNPKDFLKTFQKSLDYLRLDYVDLLALHGVNHRQFLEWSLKKNGCVAAARKLQRDGLVRHLGFSTHATTDIILDAVNSAEFDYLNVHWYFVNDLNWPAIEAAGKLDMGVFIISPNDKGGKLYSPPKKLVDLCAPLTPMQFNDLYCLARKEVHTLSCGAARPTDFDEHIRALDHYDNIAETIAPVERRLREEMERTLGADWCRRWFEGLPHYVDVPGEINVSAAGAMPTTTCGCPSSVIVRPTTFGSPPKRRRQSASPIIAASAAPTCSSSPENPRPASGAMPSAGKTPVLSVPPVSCSASPSPLRL